MVAIWVTMWRKILKIYVYDLNVQVRCLGHNVLCMNELKINGHCNSLIDWFKAKKKITLNIESLIGVLGLLLKL